MKILRKLIVCSAFFFLGYYIAKNNYQVEIIEYATNLFQKVKELIQQ